MQANRARMYYRIGEWAYFERERGDGKVIARRLARRRLDRELRRDPEGA